MSLSNFEEQYPSYERFASNLRNGIKEQVRREGNVPLGKLMSYLLLLRSKARLYAHRYHLEREAQLVPKYGYHGYCPFLVNDVIVIAVDLCMNRWYYEIPYSPKYLFSLFRDFHSLMSMYGFRTNIPKEICSQVEDIARSSQTNAQFIYGLADKDKLYEKLFSRPNDEYTKAPVKYLVLTLDSNCKPFYTFLDSTYLQVRFEHVSVYLGGSFPVREFSQLNDYYQKKYTKSVTARALRDLSYRMPGLTYLSKYRGYLKTS